MSSKPSSLKQRYKVLNPRGIPKGTPILRRDNKEWFEGDEFVKPTGMTAESLQNHIDRGFLEEK